MRALPIALLLCFVILASLASAQPILVSGNVTSTGSDTNSVYVFTVTYRGNVSAAGVFVVLNGESVAMEEVDSRDFNYTVGKIYFLETELEAGVNRYSFKCVDAEGNATSSPVKMLLVKDVSIVPLTHLDVVFAVLVWMPFVVYFIHLARKTTRALERMEKHGDERRPPGEGAR